MMNKDDNLRNSAGRLTGLLTDRTVSHEVSDDLTLPDHLPEARRVLSVKGRILPPAKYVSRSGVECNGNIDYSVLYVGADGGLYSAELSSEYEVTAPLDNGYEALSDGTAVAVSTVSEGISARMSAPRRINIKNRLRSHIRAYADMSVGEESFGGGDIQCLRKDVENATVCALSSEPIELSCEIGGLSEDTRVISADATVTVSDLRRSSDCVDASGDVVMKLLVCKENGRAETLTAKIPFSGTADSGEAMSDAMCSVYGRVTDINVNVEDGKAVCNLSMVLCGMGAVNRQASYVADVYSTDRECECLTESYSLPTVRVCGNGNFSQSERISASEAGVPEGAWVIDAWGSASLDSCEYSGGKYVFSGQSRYSLLCEKDGEYSVCNVELPIKYEIDGAYADSVSFDALADVIACRARADGDTLSIDAEIAAYTSIFDSSDISVVSETRFGEPFAERKCRMVVYYPADGEGVWDVAKKYHVPADSLSAEKNYYLF